MTKTTALSSALCRRVLRCFGLPTDSPPNLDTLRQLLARYTRAVPWESASRIGRRARYQAAADCALLGADFWASHLESGAGGTCYESNYAFFGLLRFMGFEGYLTINDMGGAIGCHSAITIIVAGQKYLVDVGYPVHAVIPLNDSGKSSVCSAIMDYTIEPLGADRYALWRETQPRVNAFQLNDAPVAEADYRAIAMHDYRHDGGQFLDKIVIHKVIDEQLWRFNGDERPWRIQQFVEGERRDHELADDPAAELSEKFGIARKVVAEAMRALDSRTR
ncbi:MAG: arylamine N-acetyltransferase [Chloroflexi bacterium]|nr:arylamine N-acetyltransferase [Chloroflexota bacterium]